MSRTPANNPNRRPGKPEWRANPMKREILNILHLEDNARDVDLVAGWLEDEGIRCEIRSVQTAPAFEMALMSGEGDLIISDFTLPTFDGLKALALARERFFRAASARNSRSIASNKAPWITS